MTRHDPEVARLEAELRGTLDRIEESMNQLHDKLSMVPITFRADHRLEAEISAFMMHNRIDNQSQAIRALVAKGLRAG